MTKLTYKPHRAFDWVVCKVECPSGHTFRAEVTQSGPRSNSANFTLHSAGVLNAKCLTDDLPMITHRLPGMSTLDLNPLRAGTFEFLAEQDSTWWCINFKSSNSSLPNIAPVVIESNTSRTFHIGSRLFLGEGEATLNGNTLEFPISLRANTQNIEITCTANTYGFLFSS
jgi:hypothetical protein